MLAASFSHLCLFFTLVWQVVDMWIPIQPYCNLFFIHAILFFILIKLCKTGWGRGSIPYNKRPVTWCCGERETFEFCVWVSAAKGINCRPRRYCWEFSWGTLFPRFIVVQCNVNSFMSFWHCAIMIWIGRVKMLDGLNWLSRGAQSVLHWAVTLCLCVLNELCFHKNLQFHTRCFSTRLISTYLLPIESPKPRLTLHVQVCSHMAGIVRECQKQNVEKLIFYFHGTRI